MSLLLGFILTFLASFLPHRFNCTLVVYGYVIAETGKEHGFDDCDINTDQPSLCTNGAEIIRNEWDTIINRYKMYAQKLSKIYPSSQRPSIWLIEPDFVQYSILEDTQFKQVGGAIPTKELAGRYFNEIVAAIKTFLPDAQIGLDISPWLNDRFNEWYSSFDKSKINLLFTSGGDTRADMAKIRSRPYNDITWEQVASYFKLPILADAGYGVGGESNDQYDEWLKIPNVSNRYKDGVRGLSVSVVKDKVIAFQESIKPLEMEACIVGKEYDDETTTETTSDTTSDSDTNDGVSFMIMPSLALILISLVMQSIFEI